MILTNYNLNCFMKSYEDKMLYLWEIPGCPQKLMAVYNRELSPDRFLFLDGVRLMKTKQGRS